MKKKKEIFVIKASGETAPFHEDKLRASLMRSGADDKQIEQILSEVSSQLYQGISTKKIYRIAFNLLKSGTKPFAARYQLKQGIMELGPSGYPFEKFVGEILSQQGYSVQVGQIVKGKCVNHEVDVIALADHHHYMIECKYHNQRGTVCDVKIPLYIQSRFKDVDKQTNWYVITGGPSSGKTTTINLLRDRGYITTMEHARHFLDTQRLKGRTIEEVRENQREFQLGVLDMQIEQENEINPEIQVFLDRAIPDALAYCMFLNLSVDVILTEALRKVSYKKIFIMDYLPLVNDYARKENVEAQKKIHSLITEVYEALPFPVVHVPVLSANERVDFILNNL